MGACQTNTWANTDATTWAAKKTIVKKRVVKKKVVPKEEVQPVVQEQDIATPEEQTPVEQVPPVENTINVEEEQNIVEDTTEGESESGDKKKVKKTMKKEDFISKFDYLFSAYEEQIKAARKQPNQTVSLHKYLTSLKND